MPRVALTKGNIERLKPKPSRYYVTDARTPGLALAVQPSGDKSFYLYRRINGRPQRVRIGSYPAVTPEQARDAAQRLNGEIAQGGDPSERRRMRKRLTLGQVFDHYKSTHLEPHSSPASLAEDTRRFTKQGLGSQRRYMMLHEGVKFENLSINPDDGQFLQTSKLTDERICRMFRIPPSIVGITGSLPRANHEQETLAFATNCVRPWLVRIEQELQRKLFAGTFYFAEFALGGLLRGDTATRFQAYAIGRQWGWLSANDIRRLENLNPIPDGDRYIEPLNMTTPSERPALPDDGVDRGDPLAERLAGRNGKIEFSKPAGDCRLLLP